MKLQESFIEKLAKEIIKKFADFENEAKKYLNTLFPKVLAEGSKKGQMAFIKVSLSSDPMVSGSGYNSGYYVMTNYDGITTGGGLGDEAGRLVSSASGAKKLYEEFVNYFPYVDYEKVYTLKEFLSAITFHVIKFKDMLDLQSKLRSYKLKPSADLKNEFSYARKNRPVDDLFSKVLKVLEEKGKTVNGLDRVIKYWKRKKNPNEAIKEAIRLYEKFNSLFRGGVVVREKDFPAAVRRTLDKNRKRIRTYKGENFGQFVFEMFFNKYITVDDAMGKLYLEKALVDYIKRQAAKEK